MPAQLKREPSSNTTNLIPDRFGEQLVNVRYRYDNQRGKRYKTVELIVEEMPYAPAVPKRKPETLVGVRIGISEGALQKKVKQVGATWNRARQVWELRYSNAVELGLVDRIVNEDRSISRSSKEARK